MMNASLVDWSQVVFTDSNGRTVKYNGSKVSWRISAYSLVKKNEQVMLIKSTREELYDLPGGGIEMGESMIAGLSREAQEEAGIKIKPEKIIGYYEDYFYHKSDNKFYQTLLVYFQSAYLGRTSKPTDPRIGFAEFVNISDLKQYPMLSYVEKIILENLDV